MKTTQRHREVPYPVCAVFLDGNGRTKDVSVPRFRAATNSETASMQVCTSSGWAAGEWQSTSRVPPGIPRRTDRRKSRGAEARERYSAGSAKRHFYTRGRPAFRHQEDRSGFSQPATYGNKNLEKAS